MKLFIRAITTILLLLSFQRTTAQFYDTGTDPASIKWSQIKTDNFRVVFPSSFRNEALKSAQMLEEAFTAVSPIYSQNNRSYRTNVVIHNYSSESNGYVAWAPRRMELYPAPTQNSTPQMHLRQLAFHETVHVLQMKSLEQGFTRFMSWFGGQQFTGAVASMLPQWYYEGDAVLYESILNAGGRGNNPAFNKELKALYFARQGGFSYDKILLGSYRDYTPDHYKFGFRIMEYSRARYGREMWRDVITFTAKYPFTLNPVNLKLRSLNNLTKKRLYYETFDTLQILWNKESLIDASVEYDVLNPDKRDDYVNYHSPAFVGIDSITAIKTSYYHPSSIVLLTKNGKNEKQLTITGNMYPWLLSAGGGKLVWAENSPDPRWENRNYSNIITYDLSSGILRKLTSRSRLTAPSISPDGMFIVASENSVENLNSLVIIDALDGSLINRIPTPDNGFPQRPRWSDDGKKISTILLTESGEGIFTYSNYEDKWETIIGTTYIDLSDAFLKGDTLFYISAITGTDNLFGLLPDGKTLRLTRSRFGISGFDVSGGDLLFSDYTHKGHYIGRLAIKGESFSTESGEPVLSSFLTEITNNSTENILPTANSSGISSNLQVTPYRKWQHLFNVHSWMPFYADIEELAADPLAVRPGATIFSQNLMSSLISSIGYEYSDRNHFLHTGITWKGWYPVINFDLSYGGEPSIVTGSNPGVAPAVINPAMRTSTEISIPLQFTVGRFSQYLRPSFNHQYVNRYIYKQAETTFDYGQHFLSGRLFFSNSRRASYRDIYPSWAQVIDVNYMSSPFDEDLYGSLSTLRTTFYFPGLFRNHGLRIRYQTEVQNPVRFLHFNRAMFPRGYRDIISERLNSFSADYVFPIFYPDIAIDGILYIKRFRGSFFGDLSEGFNNRYLNTNEFRSGTEKFLSFGGELLSDFNLFRIPFDITGGARIGYIPDQSRTFVEAVFSVDIHGFTLGRKPQKIL
jgi:hypothetical protein